MRFLAIAGVFLVFCLLFAVIYAANQSTPKPDNCDQEDLECSECTSLFCGNKKKKEK